MTLASNRAACVAWTQSSNVAGSASRRRSWLGTERQSPPPGHTRATSERIRPGRVGSTPSCHSACSRRARSSVCRARALVRARKRQLVAQLEEGARLRSGEAGEQRVDRRPRDGEIARDGDADEGQAGAGHERDEVVDVGRQPPEVDRAVGAELQGEHVLELPLGERLSPVRLREAAVEEEEATRVARVPRELEVPAFPGQPRADGPLALGETRQQGLEVLAGLRASLEDPSRNEERPSPARAAGLDVVLHPPERAVHAPLDEGDAVRGGAEAAQRRPLVGRLAVDAVDQDVDRERALDPAQDLPHRPDRLAAVARARREVEERVGVEEEAGDRIVVGSGPEAGRAGPIEDVAGPPVRAAHQLRTEGQPLAVEEPHELRLVTRARETQRPGLDGIRPVRRGRHRLEHHLGRARRGRQGNRHPEDRRPSRTTRVPPQKLHGGSPRPRSGRRDRELLLVALQPGLVGLAHLLEGLQRPRLPGRPGRSRGRRAPAGSGGCRPRPSGGRPRGGARRARPVRLRRTRGRAPRGPGGEPGRRARPSRGTGSPSPAPSSPATTLRAAGSAPPSPARASGAPRGAGGPPRTRGR